VSVRFVYYLALGGFSRVNAFIKRMKTRGLISRWVLVAIGIVAILAILNRAVADEETNTNAPVLHTRTFKFEGDPNKFYSDLLRVNNISEKNRTQLPDRSAAELQSALIGFFNAIGVNLVPPKSIFFSDRQGTLTVHATDEDLELIEQALNVFTNIPPEVQITVRFFELAEDAVFSPGLESFSKPNGNISKSAVWGSGVLTESEFKTLLKHLKEKAPTASENKSEVTTLSGRQANFGLADLQSELNTNIQPQINYYREEESIPLTLDVVPYVASDGYTIQMTRILTRTDMVGTGALTSSIVTDAGRVPITGQLPMPHSRVRQVVESCIVWDGQTAVLLLNPDYSLHGKELVIFVTATILDPSGNRKNSAGSLPFAQKAVPAQTPY
jgi:hypothetical protein